MATTARKKKNVQNQPRDRFGRWVSKGANIKWREDGRNKIGIVKSALNGIATVEEKNGDGSPTGNTAQVPLETIQVLASKAKLPGKGGSEYTADSDDLATTLEDPAFKTELEKTGSQTITTPSGYSLEVKDKDDTNPLAYQLYAPGKHGVPGKSLGIFAQEALPLLQKMLDEAAEPTEDAPEVAKGSVSPEAKTAEFAVTSTEPKSFRVPPQVKQEISSVLESGHSTFSGEDLVRAKALAYDETVSMSDIKWIGSFFSEIEAAERLRGGFKGRKWASKILEPQTMEDRYAPEESDIPENRYDFDDEVFDFFAVGSDEMAPESFALIAVDYTTDAVYVWKEEGFEWEESVDLETFEAPSITPVDVETAIELAKYLDSSVGGEYDLLDSDQEERDLFLMAEAELDFEEMDRVFTIIADATGYTPQERSVNASRQKRGPGGKFGGGQATGAAPEGQLTAQFPKAKLTSELPLVADISARIEEWIATAPEGSLTASVAFAGEVPAEATETPVEPAEAAPAEETASEEALYFAIVDEVDKTAVMNAFAIIKQAGGPKAYLREHAKWAESPDVLADVQGTTPPPVVELDIPEPAKSVLAQIDQHDSTETQQATDSAEEPAVVTASAIRGYCLPDGSFTIYTIDDLKSAVKDIDSVHPELEFAAKEHIRKRAQALNRMDVVPAQWRTPTAIERGTLLASASPIMGEFGEIITASGGHRGHRGGNAATLKRYWTVGKGALKIRWGTKGDLTRAHRHLAKYVGPERAWGLAQNYHKSLFGISNYKRDNG